MLLVIKLRFESKSLTQGWILIMPYCTRCKAKTFSIFWIYGLLSTCLLINDILYRDIDMIHGCF